MADVVAAKTRKTFYGWWIVLASAIVSLYSAGTFHYGFTGFFKPMSSEFGWSATATSLAFSLQRLQGGIASPLFGFLTDRFGPRKVMMSGLTFMGLGLLLMSQIKSLTMFYVTFLIVSAGSAAGSGGVGMVAVSNWFDRDRSKALGVMASVVGTSGTLVPPLVWMIGRYGWRSALIAIGLGTLLICLPVSTLIRNRPEQYGMLPDGALRRAERGPKSSPPESSLSEDITDDVGFGVMEALRTNAFWLLALGQIFGQLAQGAMFVHEMPYLISIGISPETGALVVMFMTLTSILGRIGFGWLGDYMDKRIVLAMTYGLLSAGVLMAAFAQDLWHVALFVAAFAPGYGGSIPVRPALQGDFFGRKAFGAIQGLTFGVTTVGGIFGPVFAGWMYDVNGNYQMAWIIIAILTLLGIPATLLAKRPFLKSKVQTLAEM